MLCSAQTDSIIQRENAKPGTRDWVIPFSLIAHDRTTLTNTNTEIEGYASATSVNRGDSISFYVNTLDSAFTIEFFRLGWYQGMGGRRMTQPVHLSGVKQLIPSPAQDNTLLLECNWTNPYTLTIPTNAPDADGWISGIYLAKLTAGTSQYQAYIWFVVRDDQRLSKYIYQWPCNTYQAYNDWAGLSYYANSNTNLLSLNTNLSGLPHKVSFNRPYVYVAQYWDFESMMVSFLESQGFDVSYWSDLDAHEQGSRVLNHLVWLTVGHSEYWSWPMRQAVETARDNGVSLGFFAGNVCYWQVRFEPSTITSQQDRTMVSYKDTALRLDPYATGGDPSKYPFITTLWRNNSIKPPEDALVGVLSPAQNKISITNLLIGARSNWVCSGTGFTNGSVVPMVVGYEIDALGTNTPLGTTLLARSPVVLGNGSPGHSDMTLYTAASGADVLATGTIQWAASLTPGSGNWPRPDLYPNPGAQQLTLNVLTRLARCAGPQRNMVGWWAGEGNGADELGRNPGTFPQGVSFTNGMAGQGFWFNGTNQYFAVTSAVAPSMVSTQISFDAWILPAATPPSSGVIFAAADANGSAWFTLTAQFDGSLQVALVTTNSSGSHQLTYASGVPVLVPGQVQHLAVTTDSGSGQTLAFVDGAPAVLALHLGTQATGSSVFPSASQFYIGGLPPSTSSHYFQGLIDEVGLYARVISPDEVLGIYNARSGGRCGDEARLTLSRVGSTNRLSWPLGALGFALQSTSDLSRPWVTETNTSVINGNQFVFDTGSASGLRFYRLAKTGR